MKRCCTCKQLKSLDNFTKNRSTKDGLASNCIICKRISAKISDMKHQNTIKNYRKTDKFKNSIKNWYKNNIEHRKNYDKLHKKTYAHLYNFYNSTRQAKKLQATPKWLTKEQLDEIKEFYTICKELQWLSDPTDPLTVDHIVPLQGENVSGLHVPWNLQILPKSLNSSKRNKF